MSKDFGMNAWINDESIDEHRQYIDHEQVQKGTIALNRQMPLMEVEHKQNEHDQK